MIRIKKKEGAWLANDAGTEGEGAYMILANEMPVSVDLAQDWVTIAPYGSFKHSVGLQVFERRDAEAIVSDFHSLANSVARMVGLPWYIGHPDHKDFLHRYKDTRAYGRIKGLRAGENGLEGRVKWSKQGKELVNEGMFHQHSPNWWGVPDKQNRWRPNRLKSVGFTNEPNIPVPPITRANEEKDKTTTTTTTSKKMDERIKQELLAAGIIKPGASDDEARAGVASLCNEARDLRTQNTALETRATAAETALATEKTGRESAETALANERKERATLVVDAAVERGVVATGERDNKITELANESDAEKFGTSLTALANEKGNDSGMKTGSKVGNLGGRDRAGKNGDLSIRERTEELANEIAKGGQVTPGIYEAAYSRLRKQSPELFETEKAS